MYYEIEYTLKFIYSLDCFWLQFVEPVLEVEVDTRELTNEYKNLFSLTLNCRSLSSLFNKTLPLHHLAKEIVFSFVLRSDFLSNWLIYTYICVYKYVYIFFFFLKLHSLETIIFPIQQSATFEHGKKRTTSETQHLSATDLRHFL